MTLLLSTFIGGFFILSLQSDGQFYTCVQGNQSKCLGDKFDNFRIGFPNSDAKLILENITENSKQCYDNCVYHANCFMAVYEKQHRKCQFFDRISFNDNFEINYDIYIWKCCNLNTSISVGNRCPGFWKMNYFSLSINTMRENDYLVKISRQNLYNCQKSCLENSICGAINVEESADSYQNCGLVLQFPVENLFIKHNIISTTYSWQCAQNYTLPIPSSSCTGKTGYWIIEKQSTPMPNNLQTLLFFYTYNYKACLNNCKHYEHCYRVWYSKDGFFCMLESDGLASCADNQQVYSYTFTTYIWKNCITDNQLITKEHKTIRKCRTILDNRFMLIYHTNCRFAPSNESFIQQCFKPFEIDLKFVENFHCRNNQSFQILEDNSLQFANFSWTKVFTGYESFWLGNVTENNFAISHPSRCDIYNSNMKPDEPKHLEIISRKNWFAKKSKFAEEKFPKNPVPLIIITDTERPFCNCFTKEACSFQMRFIQDLNTQFWQIPYNFIVTGNGMIYEGKGLKYKSQVSSDFYKDKSLSIALCGRYHKNPSVISLNSVKKLINQVITKNKVEKNYTLYLLRDIGRFSLPFEGLTSVIELWPHYRGHINPDCGKISSLIIFLNIFSVIFSCIGFTIIYHFLIKKLFHCRLCSVIRKFKMGNICIIKPDNDRHFLSFINSIQIEISNSKNLFISPFTSSIIWIERRNTIKLSGKTSKKCMCKTSIFSYFDLLRFQTSLFDINMVSKTIDVQYCKRFLVFVFEHHSLINHQNVLILHCNSRSSIEKCIELLNKQLCLCSYFKISNYNPKTKDFKLFHNSVEMPKFTETTNSSIRSEIERTYSFIIENSDSVCFYR